MYRRWVGALLVLFIPACGGGSLTVSEYAAEVERLVAEMQSRFAALDGEWESQPPTLEGATAYWEGRLDIREDFLDGVEALDPPEVVQDQHDMALDLFGRITAADEALAARVATFDTITDHWEWVDTPEGRASDAVLADVYEFCRSSQAEYDSTEERESLEEVDWLPADMKEVVKVAFGCPS